MVCYTGVSHPSMNSYAGGPDIHEISQWRRDLMGILRELDDNGFHKEFETIAGTIQRLTNAKKIPRPIASMMRTITAARNEMEYDDRPMSQAEGVAVCASWAAVQDWFGSHAK